MDEDELKSTNTMFVKQTLRSGKKIEYDGSIVIIGDVNYGSEVNAGESIVVLGNLRGVAHAGINGNKKAIITAAKMSTPQIRIANIIKEIENYEENTYENPYVYVCEDKIEIELR